MGNTKSRMYVTFDNKVPSLIVNIPKYRQGYIDTLRRGATISCITEVTPENIGECKELLQLVTELRHMNGMKGGIAINESEYMATTVLKDEEPLTQVIYTDASEVVAQGKCIFDTMWKNAIPAIEKIREIEEGKSIAYTTEILSRSEGSLDEVELGNPLNNAKEIDIVASTEGLEIGQDFFRNLIQPIQKEKKIDDHRKIRVLVEVSKYNIDIVKNYINLDLEVRHLKKEPHLYFAVTDFNMMATIERIGPDDMAESVLYSNDPLYIKRFKAMFERLWYDSRSAEEIINLIQKDREVPIIETIESSDKTIRLIRDSISSADTEILVVLPSFEAFQKQIDAGMFDHIRKVSQQKKLTIKILVTGKIELPSGKSDVQIGAGKFRLSFKSKYVDDMGGSDRVYEFTTDTIENMTVRSVYGKTRGLQMGMVIVDRSKSIVVEPKQTQSNDLLDYISMSFYSHSSQISKSYATMFDALWKYVQTSKIFERSLQRLQTYDNMQREFIDILAHELRTPLQSIIGLNEIVKERTKEKENKELLETIAENGARLHMFIENVLTATKLEGYLSDTTKEFFDLNVLINEIVDNYRMKFQNLSKSSLSTIREIYFDCKGLEHECKVKANKFQISMVITNIIDNAINFIPNTQKGLISITAEHRVNDVTVHIKDNGEGIHPEILPRLFTKFTTKWFYGAGLGLYTSQKIIFRHNGVLWAQNNPQTEKGATFSFRLPLIDSANRLHDDSKKEGY